MQAGGLRAIPSGSKAVVGITVRISAPATILVRVRNARTGQLLALEPGTRLASETLARQGGTIRAAIRNPGSLAVRVVLDRHRLARGQVYRLEFTAVGVTAKRDRRTIRIRV